MTRARELGRWVASVALNPKRALRDARRRMVARAWKNPGGIWDFAVSMGNRWTGVIAFVLTLSALLAYLWRDDDGSPVIDLAPAWWVSLILGSLFVASFRAYHNVRKKQYQLQEQRKPRFVVSNLQPVHTQTTLFEEYGPLDVYGGVRLFRLIRIGLRNKGAETIKKVHVQLESMSPTEGVPVPVEIGALLDNRLLRRAPFDIQPDMTLSIYLAAYPLIGPESGSVYLILDHEHLTREIPISVQHDLRIAVFGDDVVPLKFSFTILREDFLKS